MALTIKKFDANTRLVILPLFLSFLGYLVIGTVAEPGILESLGKILTANSHVT
jgi:hypothetical protein